MKDGFAVFLGLQYTSGNFPASCHAKEVSFFKAARLGTGQGRQRTGQKSDWQAGGLKACPTSPWSSRLPGDLRVTFDTQPMYRMPRPEVGQV